MQEPIAIIGIGCRFPGGVDSPESFWNLLINEVDAITEIPPSRFDLNAYYDAIPATPGKVMSRWGGYLDNIDMFDAAFFGISPREAERMDPQQRLLLEVAWEALEDAGQVPDTDRVRQTGVFVGMWLSDFEGRLFRDPAKTDFYMTTGSGRYSASGRLSYNLGLQGPSLTVDTACSSSLVAVHLAVQSLRNSECNMALAGAANVILQPHITIAYSQSKMMAPDGHCKFGDARADGYVRSEGAAMIALKRLSDAQADGDPIYAVIRGSAVNNDGKTSGFMATPGSEGQEEMLRKAYANAEVSPGAAHYVEAHGTGTNAGDPVEIGALGKVLGEGRPTNQYCMIGSVKTNFGHTEGAAGLAGLIKVALSLQHQTIPASLHFQNPSPKIPWDQLPVRVQAKTTTWPEHEGRAIAGVSAFGIAGTNAHVVLEEAPEINKETTTLQRRAELLPLSAQSDEALRELAVRFQTFVKAGNLANICYTASTSRIHHSRRLAVIADSGEAMTDQLTAFLSGETPRGVAVSSHGSFSPRKIVFVFPGQGGQWAGMGRQLLDHEPVFRGMMERCEEAMLPLVNWRLIDELQAGTRLDEIDVVQPMLFAVQVSLAALWRSWSIEPDAIIGHSMGEVAGAYVAGILSLEDAARVICRRSQLMKRVSGKGAMTVVELTFDEALEAIGGYEDRLGIAVSNGPRSTVISGDSEALEVVVEQLKAREVFCRPVKVDVAAHSPHMDALRPELVEELRDMTALEAAIPVYSTVTGSLRDSTAFDRDYWGANLRQPVLFASAVQQALSDGYNTFIEISPHPVLLAAVEQSFKAAGLEDGLTLASTRRDENEQAGMLEALGKLYAAGHSIDWKRIHSEGRTVRLPRYPWQRERFWVAEAELEAGAKQPARRAGAHPILGQYFRSHNGNHFWETHLDLQGFPYLGDHRVQGRVVLPAAAYVEMALAAAQEAFGAGTHRLEQMKFQEALFIPDEGKLVLQVEVHGDGNGRAWFQCVSRADSEGSIWSEHASGSISLSEINSGLEFDTPDTLRGRLNEVISGNIHYQVMDARRLNYGPAFQGLKTIWKHEGEALAEVGLGAGVQLSGYQMHPTVLDAGFQVLLDTLPADETMTDTFVPVSLKGLRIFAQLSPEDTWWVYARQTGSQDGLEGDVLLFDSAGHVLMMAEGLHMQRLAHGEPDWNEWLYEVSWMETAPLAEPKAPVQSGHWLILADSKGIGEELAARLQAFGEGVTLVSVGNVYRVLDASHYEVNPANPTDFTQMLHDVRKNGAAALRGVIHLWTLNIEGEVSLSDLHRAETLGAIGGLNLTQALLSSGQTPRLWLVSPSPYPPPNDDGIISPAILYSSALWGFGATLANEHGEFGVTRVDSDGNADNLFHELWAEGEDQITLRTGRRLVARLKQAEFAETVAVYDLKMVTPETQPFRVEVTTPGILDGLKLRATARQQPRAGEVEIEVQATGLNFMNVMSALGIYPGYPNGVGPIGIECAGRIANVGVGVTEWQVGDEVVAVAYDSLGSHAITDARLVARKPARLGFEQAATIPIVFLTAHYGLNRLGGMSQGERILIHAATGGVGLAAIQLARLVGAEIWATAGTTEKRQYLYEMGIEHVMDSRTLDFADDIMEQTNAVGVDIVLNSLAGEAIPRGLGILRPYGRFLEIGKRDIYGDSRISLSPFQKSLSYFAIDLDRMSRERPAIIGAMLKEIMNWVEAGELQPIPMTIFPIREVVEAFRYIGQAKHIGKVVISKEAEPVAVEMPRQGIIRGDGSYLISGGLGGLGLETARWLAKRGARQLVLAGRRLPSPAADAVIDELQSHGVDVQVVQADVSEPAHVKQLITNIQEHLMPLRGVIHTAGVLEDSTIVQLDPERFRRAMSPKMDGAWNLHIETEGCPLDFFVMYSSVAGLLGTAGQANYAAGNAFLDGLTHYRRRRGLPAMGINWGPWSEVGLAAAQENRGGRLVERGLGSIKPEQGIAILERLIDSSALQAAAMPFDVVQWVQAYPSGAKSSFLKDMLQAQSLETVVGEQSPDQSDDVRTMLLASEAGRPRRTLLETHIREQVARVLGLAVSRVDVNKPLRNMGIDSLMTLELRNRLEATLKLTLPATLVFNYPTVAALAEHLAEKMDISLVVEKVEISSANRVSPVNELQDLSKDEVEAMLAEELKSLDELLKGS